MKKIMKLLFALLVLMGIGTVVTACHDNNVPTPGPVVPTVGEISVKQNPTKVVYEKGEQLDLTGSLLEVVMSDGSKKSVSITSDMVSGYDATLVGEQTITVTYEGLTTTFKVTVNEPQVEDRVVSVSVKKNPTKDVYEKGEQLDLTGAILEVTMSSGSKVEISIISDMVSGYDAALAGEQTITVTYEGLTTTFKVTVNEPVVEDEIDSISIIQNPTKVVYEKGEQLDLTGAILVVLMTSGASSEINITFEMISGYDSDKIGEQVVRVTYEGFVTVFKVTVNEPYVEPLYALPNGLQYIEDLPTILVGEELQLTVRSGATVTSSNEAVATVDATGKIVGLSYGTTVITVSQGEEVEEFTLIVTKTYGQNTVSQEQLSTTQQGVNNLYVYRMDNGDIEGDLQAGLQALELYVSNGDSWWNGTSFIGPNHFGGSGVGAIAYRAAMNGNYTVDYSAWLETGIRKNPEYMTWDVDGFTTGIAKRDANGNITVLVSNIGTKESVYVNATRYQMGTYTVDLLAGEELLVFMASNGNGACDEVFTDIYFTTNSTVVAPLCQMPEGVQYIEDLASILVGNELQLTVRSGATVTSSNEAVATVDATGKIVGLSYGTTVITVSQGEEVEEFTLIVTKTYGQNTVSQEQLSTTQQGVNNLYVYRMDNGDIEGDLQAGLQALELYVSNGDSWWNGTSFIGPNHFGGSGVGAIAYRAAMNGNYTVDYSAWLETGIRKNPEYMTWDVDGFTTGIAKRDANGNITVLVSNIGTKESVYVNATRYQMGTYTVDLLAGEELLVFMVSNGNGACDEVFTDIYFTKN